MKANYRGEEEDGESSDEAWFSIAFFFRKCSDWFFYFLIAVICVFVSTVSEVVVVSFCPFK